MATKRATRRIGARRTGKLVSFNPYTPLTFKQVQKTAQDLADHIETHFEEIAHVLLEYESYEVVVDEVGRTLDILRSLEENKEYFKLRVGEVAAFLPRNQPLYALTCFVLVPSLMAKEVHFRIPNSMKHFFPKLLSILEVQSRFPNVCVSHLQRSDFLRERSALRINPKTGDTIPATDAVIFTGNSLHAEQLRFIFDKRTLFITNGSGHNPVVVAEDADIEQAVSAVLTLQLYNQGQDCAAPNTILVHGKRYVEFLRTLRDEIRTIPVGDYRNRTCRVGPISDPKDLVRIQDFLIENRQWLDPTTPGTIRAHDAILEPTIIAKPLSCGGNYNEIFAPVIVVQRYETDKELSEYFEDDRYIQNAMYVTLYGTSNYVQKLIGREIEGKILHDENSFLHNTHLHAPGEERGTKAYGGNGIGACSISIDDVVTAKATLPQRDIYEQIALPIIKKRGARSRAKEYANFTEIRQKNVEKLLRLKTSPKDTDHKLHEYSYTYIDAESVRNGNHRFSRIDPEYIYHLLLHPNAQIIARLSLSEIEQVRSLRTLLQSNVSPTTVEQFKTALYSIPKDPQADAAQNRENQQRFFRVIYQLTLGQNTGPRLPQFLLEIDRDKLCELLDV